MTPSAADQKLLYLKLLYLMCLERPLAGCRQPSIGRSRRTTAGPQPEPARISVHAHLAFICPSQIGRVLH
jgi:hypothetical protein